MPVHEADPWRFQYFAQVPCPDDVHVPTEDSDAWVWYPAQRWIYDRLAVAQSQGIAAAPHGVMPDSFPVFSKPIINLRGMGTGSRRIASAVDYRRHIAPGHFWMELLTGAHVSSDIAVQDGHPKWWRHTVGKPGRGGTFDYWIIGAAGEPQLERDCGAWIARCLPGYTGMLNIETIGGRIIEAHLRFADQWPDLYGPGWVDAAIGLYATGRWDYSDDDRRTGYSVVLFGPKGRRYRHPDSALTDGLLREDGVSSVQITFHEDRDPRHHAMPPGGFRLGIVNCHDLGAGLRAREALRAYFFGAGSEPAPTTTSVNRRPVLPDHDTMLAARASAQFDRRRYDRVRQRTEALVATLSPEDQNLQSMPDASPAKWHRAHTTWFFEEFVLLPFAQDYRAFDPQFRYLFNSYYEAVGARQPRAMRGLISRPSADQVTAYRRHVDAGIARLPADLPREARDRIELGLQHEEQHQELLVTDTLDAFAQHPDCPAVLPGWTAPAGAAGTPQPVPIDGGLVEIGHDGAGFAFDNEGPRHKAYLAPYRLGSHLVRNRDMTAFIADGGYRTAALWMSEGWQKVQDSGWESPLRWHRLDGAWQQATPGGLLPLDPDEPVRHVSWYEADAFARWAEARLPTETEWEASAGEPRVRERTGHVWQWTSSAYSPYPGFRPPPGAIGEYNGKFMINQMVLRGGSAVTPEGHARPTYRNFFHPDRRWQFSGIRLAWDA